MFWAIRPRSMRHSDWFVEGVRVASDSNPAYWRTKSWASFAYYRAVANKTLPTSERFNSLHQLLCLLKLLAEQLAIPRNPVLRKTMPMQGCTTLHTLLAPDTAYQDERARGATENHGDRSRMRSSFSLPGRLAPGRRRHPCLGGVRVRVYPTKRGKVHVRRTHARAPSTVHIPTTVRIRYHTGPPSSQHRTLSSLNETGNERE